MLTGLVYGMWAARVRVALLCCTACVTYSGNAATVEPAQALRAQYEALADQLHNSPFGQPLLLQSAQQDKRLSGEIRAVINHDFASVRARLKDPENWCEVMTLHINTKFCQARRDGGGDKLRVYIGNKTPQELVDASRVDFDFRVRADNAQHLEIAAYARDGPMGTGNYQIRLQAIGLSEGRSFLSFHYSHTIGLAGQLAMQVYFSTVGRDKVGFSMAEVSPDGQTQAVQGMRGMIERNAMRYYLAIDAFLAHAGVAPLAQQRERRLQSWFSASERYGRQLHEVERQDYLVMKRAEYQRQQGGA